MELVSRRQTSGDELREWLAQFGGPLEQRRALHVAKHLRFYSGADIRSRLGEAHQRVTAGWRRQLQRGHTKFTDVLVVPLDERGKSGWTYGSIYAVENQIHKGNIVDSAGLRERLHGTKREIRAVVFVDDFVGSGENAIERLQAIESPVRERIRAKELLAAFVVVAGFRQGVERLETWLEGEGLPIQIYPHELLGDGDRVFSEASNLFEDPAERGSTRALFERIGHRISPEHPLGWHDGQGLVVFDSNVPNNSLPHLWIEAKGEMPWKPLFPRF